jgi:restriction system protein
MGHINMVTSSFAAALSEDAGERSGFTLTKDEMIEHLNEGNVLREAMRADEAILRISSNDYADTVGDLLFALGAADQAGMPPMAVRLTQKMGPEWRSIIDLEQMMTIEAVASHFLHQRCDTGSFDQEAFDNEILGIVGKPTYEAIREQLGDVMAVHLAHSPWFTRTAENPDPVALANLFKSETLPVPEGQYFDQRFINYLAGKPELIDDINWRQFEGFAAEWLSRSGYDVELGPGRGDEGVDVRAWRKGEEGDLPPALIVQCKRQKTKTSKVVIKALWTDVVHEGADAGLLVTTSDISPGAQNTVNARAYPITTANRAEVKRWLQEMRRPATGCIL